MANRRLQVLDVVLLNELVGGVSSGAVITRRFAENSEDNDSTVAVRTGWLRSFSGKDGELLAEEPEDMRDGFVRITSTNGTEMSWSVEDILSGLRNGLVRIV